MAADAMIAINNGKRNFFMETILSRVEVYA